MPDKTPEQEAADFKRDQEIAEMLRSGDYHCGAGKLTPYEFGWNKAVAYIAEELARGSF